VSKASSDETVNIISNHLVNNFNSSTQIPVPADSLYGEYMLAAHKMILNTVLDQYDSPNVQVQSPASEHSTLPLKKAQPKPTEETTAGANKGKGKDEKQATINATKEAFKDNYSKGLTYAGAAASPVKPSATRSATQAKHKSIDLTNAKVKNTSTTTSTTSNTNASTNNKTRVQPARNKGF
jgi:hypothetical protein